MGKSPQTIHPWLSGRIRSPSKRGPAYSIERLWRSRRSQTLTIRLSMPFLDLNEASTCFGKNWGRSPRSHRLGLSFGTCSESEATPQCVQSSRICQPLLLPCTIGWPPTGNVLAWHRKRLQCLVFVAGTACSSMVLGVTSVSTSMVWRQCP